MATAAPLHYDRQPTYLADRQIGGTRPRLESQSTAWTDVNERSVKILSPAADTSYSITVAWYKPPSWLPAVLKQVDSLLTLPAGWDSYRGEPISRQAAQKSLQMLAEFMKDGSPIPSIVPLSSGGVQIEWHRKQQDFEIAVGSDGQTGYYYHNRNNGQSEEAPINTCNRLRVQEIIVGLT